MSELNRCSYSCRKPDIYPGRAFFPGWIRDCRLEQLFHEFPLHCGCSPMSAEEDRMPPGIAVLPRSDIVISASVTVGEDQILFHGEVVGPGLPKSG